MRGRERTSAASAASAAASTEAAASTSASVHHGAREHTAAVGTPTDGMYWNSSSSEYSHAAHAKS